MQGCLYVSPGCAQQVLPLQQVSKLPAGHVVSCIVQNQELVSCRRKMSRASSP